MAGARRKRLMGGRDREGRGWCGRPMARAKSSAFEREERTMACVRDALQGVHACQRMSEKDLLRDGHLGSYKVVKVTWLCWDYHPSVTEDCFQKLHEGAHAHVYKAESKMGDRSQRKIRRFASDKVSRTQTVHFCWAVVDDLCFMTVLLELKKKGRICSLSRSSLSDVLMSFS
eukprot:761082-Hanusia_phi.AAC.14